MSSPHALLGDESDQVVWIPKMMRDGLRSACDRYEEAGYERTVIAAALRQLADELEGRR